MWPIKSFGVDLVKMLGGKVLTRLSRRGKLIPFIKKKQYKGKALIKHLGGWMKRALPLRGRKIVTYHKNWSYFVQLVGLEVVDYMEPKPGISPTPGHVAAVINKMRTMKIRHLDHSKNAGALHKLRVYLGSLHTEDSTQPKNDLDPSLKDCISDC